MAMHLPGPRETLRLLRIGQIMLRHGLDDILLATGWLRPLRWVYRLAPWRWWPRRLGPRGERIRRALEDLGPIYVKLGQIASTRRDLLPADIADELARLQDQVPPFPSDRAHALIEAALGEPLAAVFRHIDERPLASASVAQVYGAVLHDGREVVAKVLRPDIRPVIDRDLALLRLLARLAERHSREARRLRPLELVADLERTLEAELDLVQEAANASQLRRNFADSPLLYVPEVHWRYTRRNVMVMERIRGIPIDDIEALRAAGVDFKRLAEIGVEIFFKQVFVDNFFHADMHPGNIFVDPRDPARPRYLAVDFGIVGTLEDEDRRYLARNFLAFFNRDYRRVAQLHIDSGWVPRHVRLGELEAAIRAVCEPNFARPLKEISFGQVLLRLFQTVRRFDFVIQPQLVLLQKTLLNVEGLGRQLYPDLDLWQTAKPYMERALREEMPVEVFLERMPGRKPAWLRRLPDWPERFERLLRDAAEGRLTVAWREADSARLLRRLERLQRRRERSLLAASALVSAVVLLGLDGLQTPMWAGAPVLSWVLGAAALWLWSTRRG